MKRRLLLIFSGAVVLMLAVVVHSAWRFAHEGWNPHPPVTTKLVRVQDIVGTWQYPSSFPEGTITITFNADGTFQQTVSVSELSKPFKQSGRWALDKTNHVDVSGVLMFDVARWEPKSFVRWDIVDSEKRPGQFAIRGGTGMDPDDRTDEFSKVSGPAGVPLP